MRLAYLQETGAVEKPAEEEEAASVAGTAADGEDAEVPDIKLR